MEITAIERDGKRKYKFFIDGEYSFYLTAAELREYNLYSLVLNLLGDSDMILSINVNLEEDVFQVIHDEIIINRGKRYALGLLSDRDYTEKALNDKLLSAGYIQNDTDRIIEYIVGFNYLDDIRYAVNYIRSREETKSRRYIENQLRIKGVSVNDIQTAFGKVEEEHEQDGISRQEITSAAIHRTISKKLKAEDCTNQDKITKVITSLLRSGYDYSDIKICINEYFQTVSSL